MGSIGKKIKIKKAWILKNVISPLSNQMKD
jgi:hypothetical protein